MWGTDFPAPPSVCLPRGQHQVTALGSPGSQPQHHLPGGTSQPQGWEGGEQPRQDRESSSALSEEEVGKATLISPSPFSSESPLHTAPLGPFRSSEPWGLNCLL